MKASTLLTLLGVLREWGLEADKDYHYNQGTDTVTFFNESTIFLRELSQDPSDPEYDKLGSTEYTGGFIDECSQVPTKAKNIVISRLRYKIDEYGLIPKLLMCSNPTKNFLYFDFYKPYKAGDLPAYRKFVPALVTDNPYIPASYIENMKRLDRASRERLLYGNWEYDDDPSRLFEYENICNVFTNTFVKLPAQKWYLSVDVARFGTDKTIIMVWNGLYVERIITAAKQDTKTTADKILQLMEQYKIPRSQVVIDEDGVGGGIVDNLKGVRGFVNNSRALEAKAAGPTTKVLHNYGNLKAQCYYALADKVNNNEIGVAEVPADTREKLIEDLEQIKRKDPDKDGRLFVTPKEDIKENIGRSPDYGDALMMRMLFELRTSNALSFSSLTTEQPPTAWKVGAVRV